MDGKLRTLQTEASQSASSRDLWAEKEKEYLQEVINATDPGGNKVKLKINLNVIVIQVAQLRTKLDGYIKQLSTPDAVVEAETSNVGKTDVIDELNSVIKGLKEELATARQTLSRTENPDQDDKQEKKVLKYEKKINFDQAVFFQPSQMIKTGP